MRTASQAVATARYYIDHHLPVHPGWCDHYVATYWGLTYSGYSTAINHFLSIPSKYRHGFTTPPQGALVFWAGGSQGAGHVTLSLGGGYIASTDFPATGYVGMTTPATITTHWGLHYEGWTDAYYGAQGTVLVTPIPAPSPPPAPHPPPAPSGTKVPEEDPEMFMYVHSGGYCVLVANGKQVKLDTQAANAVNAPIGYRNAAGQYYGHNNGPNPMYLAQQSSAQEAIWAAAYGPVVGA